MKKTERKPSANEREVIFVTNYCRPEVNQDSGEERSIVFKAGHKYIVAWTDEMKMLHANRNIYLSDEQPPLDPPGMGKPISAKREPESIDEPVVTELVNQIVGAIEKTGEKKGWFRREAKA
jgi:hypothetical protein